MPGRVSRFKMTGDGRCWQSETTEGTRRAPSGRPEATFPEGYSIDYCCNLEDGDGYAMLLLTDALELVEDDGVPAVPRLGFETGWVGRNSPALVLAVASQTRCVVFHLRRMGDASPLMKLMFEEDTLFKAGTSFAAHHRALFHCFPHFSSLHDLCFDAMADDLSLLSSRVSLCDIFFRKFHAIIPLQRHLRVLDWTAPLSVEQQRLCALNAYCCFCLSRVLW